MITQDPSTPPSHPLFRGPYYNRRRSLLLGKPKPKISKLAGTDTWACRLLPHMTGWVPVFGFGRTPTDAYNEWKRNIGR
jgi:hypothetical protein